MNVAEILSARLIGTMFVERGLLSESQIRVALEIQRETGQQLGQILVDRFGVSRQELASVVAEQWADIGKSASPVDAAANDSWRKLGEIFVERGFVTQEQLDQALERQRETGERVGEALVAQGSISKFELAGALAEQMSVLGPEKGAAAAPADEDTNVVHLAPRLEEAPEPEPEPGVEDAAPDTPTAAAVDGPEVAPEEEPEAAPETDAEGEPEAELELVPEPEPEQAPEVELELVPEPEPQPEAELELVPEPEAGPEPVDEVVEPEPEPEAAQVVRPERRVSLVRAQPEPAEHTAAGWVAFASTTAGYRLVERSGPLPEAGATIDVPDVGELVVLRVGRSPLPQDERTCVYLEQLVRHDEVLAL
jgi:hypothetical protein